MDDQDRPASSAHRVRSPDGRRERREVHLPAVVVYEFVWHQLHVIQVRQKVEQRVTRFRHQEKISWVAQQAENERVCLAGAGGQHDVLGIDRAFLLRVVGGNCLPRSSQSLGDRLVDQGFLPVHGTQQFSVAQSKPNVSGIGGGQVKQLQALPSAALQGLGVTIDGSVPTCAL